MIELKNLNFAYTRKNKAVNNVSLEIRKGEYIAILGHNGSGKSTLVKLIVGLLKALSGEIIIDGIKLTEETIDEVRHKIGIVFQNPDNQFVGVTVKDDIAFGLENRQFSREKMVKLIDEFSKKVRMEKFLDYNPEALSGGEKQRVAIAGVLACDPEVIIFDEATAMLDPKGVREINEIIASLKHQKTIIVITHNLEEAVFADRIVVMNDGKIVAVGNPKQIFKDKDILTESSLDILESMKLIEEIEKSNLNDKYKIEDVLWEYTFKK
ncbi:MAG: energy-coupling factor transporter ATPase [Bacilli bacterium]|nr:energy-coupling factor transporter ATPase [Bacilli bacterium]